MIENKELYTKKNLQEDFGKIYKIELLKTSDPFIQNFLQSQKGKLTPAQTIRQELIKKHGDEIEKTFKVLKEKEVSLCYSCKHSSVNNCNKSDAKYWMCWLNWDSTQLKNIKGKTEIQECKNYKLPMVSKTSHEIAEILSKKYPNDFCTLENYNPLAKANPHRIEWILNDMGLIQKKKKSGWIKANQNAKNFERIVEKDFIERGFISQNRWIKISCEKGIKIKQHDGLFTTNAEAILVEVKNNAYGDEGIKQIQGYWKILKEHPELRKKYFYLFLVNFHSMKDCYYKEKWSGSYKFGYPAPNVSKISGEMVYGINCNCLD